MSFDAVIFDLDGTLCDTLDDLCASLDAACAHFGFPLRSREHHLENVNSGAYDFVRTALPEGVSKQTLDEVFDWYKAYYDEHFLDNTRPFEEMCEVVELFSKSNIKIGVLTNKLHSCTEIVLERFFGTDKFDAYLGNVSHLPPKPETPMTFELLKKMGVDPKNSRIAMVGDSDVDLHTARNAGLTAVSVSWGYRSKEYLERLSPDILIDRVADLKMLLD